MRGEIEFSEQAIDQEKEKLKMTVGISEISKLETLEDLHIEEITRNGYTLLENALSGEEVAFLQSGKLEEIYQQQLNDIGGEEKLNEMGDQFSIKHLLAYDEFFVKFLIHPKILKILEHFLGEFYILHLQNGVLNYPGVHHPAALWHRDFVYQHYTSSKPLGIGALFVIDDFNDETGGTMFLPGSHKFDAFPSSEYVNKHNKQISAKAGSILVFDSMMFHQAGFNQSPHVRRALNQIYTIPLIKQQISLPRLLKGKYSNDPVLGKLLGYGCESANDAMDYRLTRLKRGETYLINSKRVGKLDDPGHFKKTR